MTKHIAQEVLETWLTPYDAWVSFRSVLDLDTAQRVIVEALRGGVLAAAAERMSWKQGYADPEVDTCVCIETVYWSHFTEPNAIALWTGGTATIELNAKSRLVTEDATVRYFGVRFDPSTLSALITNRPPKLEWPTPYESISIIQSKTLPSANLNKYVLDRLRAGLISAVAETASKLGDGPPKKFLWYDIPAQYWDFLQAETFWESGSAQFQLSTHNKFVGASYEKVSCFGIRFDPAGVDKLIADLPKRVDAAPGSANRVTRQTTELAWRETTKRPQKEFWDELLIGVMVKILNGWQPKNQEEVAKAMLDWAAGNGHELGETAVKKPAQKVFKALSE